MIFYGPLFVVVCKDFVWEIIICMCICGIDKTARICYCSTFLNNNIWNDMVYIEKFDELTAKKTIFTLA